MSEERRDGPVPEIDGVEDEDPGHYRAHTASILMQGLGLPQKEADFWTERIHEVYAPDMRRTRTLARELYGALNRLVGGGAPHTPQTYDEAYLAAQDTLERAREAGIGGEDDQ